MNLLLLISNSMIPLIIFIIISYGMHKKTPLYEAFIVGAKSGFQIVIDLAPTLLGLMFGVAALRSSGFLDQLAAWFSTIFNQPYLPANVIPLVIVRLFSASAANSLLFDLFKTFGPDSYIGLLASIIMSCSETLFYTLSVYCVSVRVTKTRWIIPGALLSMLAGISTSIFLANIMAK